MSPFLIETVLDCEKKGFFDLLWQGILFLKIACSQGIMESSGKAIENLLSMAIGKTKLPEF